MYHIDFETLKRTPKSSALFYKNTINAHGENIGIADSDEMSAETYSVGELSSMLPEYEPVLATV